MKARPTDYDYGWLRAHQHDYTSLNAFYEGYYNSHPDKKRTQIANFRRKCHVNNIALHLYIQGPWSQKEDEFLLSHYEQLGAKTAWLIFVQNYRQVTFQTFCIHASQRLGLHSNKRGNWKHCDGDIVPYANGHMYIKNGKDRSKWIRVDQHVLGAEKGTYVVHLDGDKMNCDKANLVALSRSAYKKIQHLLGDNVDINKTVSMLGNLYDAMEGSD